MGTGVLGIGVAGEDYRRELLGFTWHSQVVSAGGKDKASARPARDAQPVVLQTSSQGSR